MSDMKDKVKSVFDEIPPQPPGNWAERFKLTGKMNPRECGKSLRGIFNDICEYYLEWYMSRAYDEAMRIMLKEIQSMNDNYLEYKHSKAKGDQHEPK